MRQGVDGMGDARGDGCGDVVVRGGRRGRLLRGGVGDVELLDEGRKGLCYCRALSLT